MIRIGICDDEQGARQMLCGTIERLMERRDMPCTIFEYSSAEGLLSWLDKHPGELDILFLDIEMHEMNGMEAARHIRRRDDTLALVFVTGYNDYVFDGYSVGALGYLTKPPDAGQLEEVLKRALGRLHTQEPDTFVVQNSEGMYRVPKDQILYFMSDRRQVTLVADQRRYAFYAKLDDVAWQAGGDFVRVHQRYLVNARAVKGMEGSVALVGEEALPVSRAHRQAAMLAIAKAMLHGEGES